MDALEIQDGLVIPADELSVTASRSSGPGGQHVNTSSTRVTLRFTLSRSRVLEDRVRERLRARAPHLVTADGDLAISSGRGRSQRQNLEDCLARLRALVLAALPEPVPRRPTRPTRASRLQRRRDKEHQTQKKRQRQPPDDADG